MGRSTILRAMLVLACASACGIFGVEDDDEQTDGNICSSDDECRTGVCTTASLCSHSACNCPSGSCAPDGEETDTCRDGWVCVGYDQIILDPVLEFFGGEANDRNGYCKPLCDGGCPEHYACDEGSVHCSPDAYWPYPIPTIAWSGAVSGELSGRDAMTTVIVEGGSTLVLRGLRRVAYQHRDHRFVVDHGLGRRGLCELYGSRRLPHRDRSPRARVPTAARS